MMTYVNHYIGSHQPSLFDTFVPISRMKTMKTVTTLKNVYVCLLILNHQRRSRNISLVNDGQIPLIIYTSPVVLFIRFNSQPGSLPRFHSSIFLHSLTDDPTPLTHHLLHRLSPLPSAFVLSYTFSTARSSALLFQPWIITHLSCTSSTVDHSYYLPSLHRPKSTLLITALMLQRYSWYAFFRLQSLKLLHAPSSSSYIW